MKPPRFAYRAPVTVHEALSLVDDGDSFVKVLAGGQSLIPTMNLRLSAPDLLVDLQGIPDLSEISRGDGTVTIGAMVRQQRVLESPEIAVLCPLLPLAVQHVGHWAIRESGTVSGSIAHADPAAEIPVAAVLLNVTINIASREEVRQERARNFFVGPYMTTLDDHEIIVSTTWPTTSGKSGYAFVEFSRRRGDFALSSVAARIRPADAGTKATVTLAMGALLGFPILFETEIEDYSDLTDDEKRSIAGQALNDVEPYDDIHATSADRIQVTKSLIVDALTLAVGRTAVRGADLT